jgi:hypothetical protein|tara:strand:- start:144 stop:779 length:636 start_codon:yes stop_codon:yes gene_type:complete
MSIQNLILGSLVSRGADKLLNPNRTSINKFVPEGGYFGQGDNEKDTKSKTFGGIAKSGIMSLIAQAILGPIFGPLALTVGKNFVDKKKQGLGFFEKPGDPTTQPQDIRGTFTAEGMQFENIQDALGSTDPNKDINYNTGVITDKTTGKDIGNVYDEVALTNVPAPPAYDFDDSGSDSGSSGGSSSASTAGDAPGYSGPSPFRYGGLASLYR